MPAMQSKEIDNPTVRAELLKALAVMQNDKAMLGLEVQMRQVEAKNSQMRKEVEAFKSQTECLRLERELQKVQVERRKAELKAQLEKEQLMATKSAASFASHKIIDETYEEDFTEQVEPTSSDDILWSSDSFDDADAEDVSPATSLNLPSFQEQNKTWSENMAPLVLKTEPYQSHKVLPDTPCFLPHQQSVVRLDKPRRVL